MALSSKVYTRAREISWKNTSGGAVLLSLGSGNYYELNTSGAYIWKSLSARRSTEAVVVLLARKYKISLSQSRRDSVKFLKHLARLGLIESPALKKSLEKKS